MQTVSKQVLPFNALTGVEYQGMNIGALLSRNFESAKWATFLQWRNLGYHVIKGEHGTYCRTFGKRENVKDGKKTSESFFKGFVLFNEKQVEKTETPADIPCAKCGGKRDVEALICNSCTA